MNAKKRARILEKIQHGRATRAERLWLKQEGLCFYCWTELDKDITKEHLHARAEGGSSDSANLRAAHMLCNGVVGTLPVELKLELHEIGRDHGAEAFWIKAKEYQQRYGSEKRAYGNVKSLSKGQRKRQEERAKLNARRRTALEEAALLSAEEAELEERKRLLTQCVALSRAEREAIYAREVEKRRVTGLPLQLGWQEFFRRLEDGTLLAQYHAAQAAAREAA